MKVFHWTSNSNSRTVGAKGVPVRFSSRLSWDDIFLLLIEIIKYGHGPPGESVSVGESILQRFSLQRGCHPVVPLDVLVGLVRMEFEGGVRFVER